jgi:transposase
MKETMLPEKRAPMRKVREILRLHFEAELSERQISKICQVRKGTIRRYLERLKAAGLSWPLPGDLDEATLEKKRRSCSRRHRRPRPVNGLRPTVPRSTKN